MRHIRLLGAWTVALIAALALAAPALALIDLAPVAASNVAIEDGAGVSAADRAALEAAADRLAAAGTPTKFVVLAAKPGDPQAYARSLRSTLSYAGSILVLSPGNLSIASPLPSATVQAAFEAERPALRQDATAGTVAVADRLSAAVAAGGTAPPAPAAGGASAQDEGGGGSGGRVLLWILAIGAAIAVLAIVITRRGAKRRAAEALAARRASLDPLVDALAAQIADLDDDMGVAGPRTAAAKEHYDAAVLSYGEARDALEAPASDAAAIDGAAASLETGLRAARRTRAVLEGRPPEAADEEPLLEGMCAFDPKHGRATTTATITTPSGETAKLPVCARCAEDLARGDQPRFREVEERGGSVPYWNSRGLGGGMGPLVGGALAGVILGGMFGGGTGMGAPDQGGGDPGGSGDSGWGGGDFGGGGGFGGGGDFGGGGGGDF